MDTLATSCSRRMYGHRIYIQGVAKHSFYVLRRNNNLLDEKKMNYLKINKLYFLKFYREENNKNYGYIGNRFFRMLIM